MNCPECGVWSMVKETRKAVGYTYRRYECANLHRFTTNEIVVSGRKGKADPKQLLAVLRLAAKPKAALDAPADVCRDE